ncbi:D-serine deaminase-like pyridoxal phosphate-dependent protein [Rubricella aquisinus]|uniref:D-serine deaminase-like pyridoxal phosphate-dependent protein n=1 Tax=Rubricella aquisinus TaxID=2028108 RepID=A0A840WIX1_9RHOB|nr:alanine racemase [Rubricella aquisinus]MBB5514451.1 D-serine deaminase-like pyridoxal phosphate-dependent protein [Rubricella aquisinus]
MTFAALETPCLILDEGRLRANATRMLDHCAARGVMLRPHAKTAKSVEVSLIATGGRRSGLTVSTLKEAEHFAQAGFDDLLYAVGITPNKFAHVARINATGQRLTLIVDSLAMARAIAQSDLPNPVMIEIDSGEHRGGLPFDDPAIVEIARALGAQLRGVMTHAGQSYATDDIHDVRQMAEGEVHAATTAAAAIRAAGMAVQDVSIGSTPTVIHAPSLDGVTEVRAGIYLFYDLCQYARNICTLDDIAMTVLSSVIGHNRAAGVITLDAGALAMSKDIGAQKHLPDAGYGWLCDPETMERLGLNIAVVHQEHGTVRVPDESWFERLPIGAMVRVLPVHACLTAAGGHGKYHLPDGRVWDRVDGW